MKQLKLKHMNYIDQDKPDYTSLMVELCGYKKKNWFYKKFLFNRIFNKVYALIKLIKTINVKYIQLNPDITIKYPANIDFITFAAMMENIALTNKNDGKTTVDSIAMTIAITCYSENHPGIDFDKDSLSFKKFLNLIEDSYAFDMFGLFNHIDKQLTDSQAIWNKQFFDVEVSDPDYTQAGGDRLNKFNIINSIKRICRDFNLKDKEAWQISYAMSQSSSLAEATSARIQHEMTKIKESRFIQNKKQHP